MSNGNINIIEDNKVQFTGPDGASMTVTETSEGEFSCEFSFDFNDPQISKEDEEHLISVQSLISLIGLPTKNED